MAIEKLTERSWLALWSFFLRNNLYIMFMRIFYILSLLLCGALLSSCADSNAINIDRSGAPALWKVSKNATVKSSKEDVTLYLFGTIHLLPKGAKWQSSTLDSAIENSDILIVETLGLDDSSNVSKIFTQMATNEPMVDITQRLDGAELNALNTVIETQDMSASTLSNLETWAATLAISNSYSSDLGLKRSLGVETILAKRFKHKPTEALETIRSQFSIFDDLNESHQRDMLGALVTDANDSRANYLRLLNAWLDGNSEALLSESDGGILRSPVVRNALLDNRNKKWAIALTEKMRSRANKRYFVAVGAAHLVGENGVPELMKSAGFTVERIQ